MTTNNDNRHHRGGTERGTEVRNSIDGTPTGTFLQAGTVHGDVHLHAPAPERLPTPRQVPPPPLVWVDREAERAALGALCRVDSVSAVVSLVGPSGIGKTALAASVLDEQADDFPDGHLYFDYHDHAAYRHPQAWVASTLRSWLRDLGFGPHLPPELEGLTGLWRSVTHGLRLVGMVDNAPAFQSPDLVRLRPAGAGSLLLVTSHRPVPELIRHGAVVHQLGPLAADAAAELLARYTRHLPARPSSYEVARICAGSPLAVSLFGAQLATDPDPLPLSLDTTNRSSTVETAVTARLNDTVKTLEEGVHAVYLAAGSLPLTELDAAVVAVACGLDLEEAQQRLIVLENKHLLEPAGAAGRYRLHDMVRLHASNRAERELAPEVRSRTLRKVAEAALAWTTEAERIVTPTHRSLPRDYQHTRPPAWEFTGDEDAVRWLRTRLPMLMALIHAAAAAQWHTLVWQQADAMWPAFLRLRALDESIDVHELGLAAAEHDGHQAAIRRMLTSGSKALRMAGRHQEAIAWCRRALPLAQEAGDVLDEAQAWSGMGTSYLAMGDSSQALEHYERALVLRQQAQRHQLSGARRQVFLTQLRLGEVALVQERWTDAAADLGRAYGGLSMLGDRYDAARAQALLGFTLVHDGYPEEGRQHLEDARRTFVTTGSAFWEGKTLELQGQVHQASDSHTAIGFYQRALDRLTGYPMDARRVQERLDRLEATAPDANAGAGSGATALPETAQPSGGDAA